MKERKPSTANLVKLLRAYKNFTDSNGISLQNFTADIRMNFILPTFGADSSNCTMCQSNGTWLNTGDSDNPDPDLMNNDRDFVLLFNFWMLGVLMPIIAVLGILANAASFIVLSHPSMRSSTINIYLAGLSGFDGMLLLFSLLLYPPMNYCELEHSDPNCGWCKYFFYSALFTYPLSLIMQSCSVWTLTAITIDRFIAISWPLRSRDWCTCKRAYVALFMIACWSILYNLPVFFELKLSSIDLRTDQESISTSPNLNSTVYPARIESETHIVLEQTELRKESIYKMAYKGYCYLFFMLLIPALIMLILNVFVAVSVRKAYRLRRAMSGREEKERRCTVMAILVVLTFLVCNSLTVVNNVLEIFVLGENPPRSAYTSYHLSVTIGNLLVALNSATNFLIYCALGLRFRIMFMKIFCVQKCCPRILARLTRSAASGVLERSYQSINIRYSVRGKDNRLSLDQHRPQNGHSRNKHLYADRDLQRMETNFDDFVDGNKEIRRSFDASSIGGLSYRAI